MPFTPRIAQHLSRRRRSVAVASLALGLVLGLNALSGPPAQAQPTPVDLVFVLPPGSNAAQLPLASQSFQLQIKNTSAAPLASLQVVLRVPPPPAYIVSVSDGSGSPGLIDNRSGVWYSTVAQINAGSSVTLSVVWQMPCPGKWPITARVGTQKAAIAPTWVGAPNSLCGPDENASPAPAGYYELQWPPSTVAAATSTSTTTILGQVLATVPSGAGATTSTLLSLLATSTTANIQPIGQATGVTTTTTTTLANTSASASTTEPLIEISVATTKATSAKTTSKTTTKTTLSSTKVTTITICKTIGGKRYCGPASSVYKPGQKKAIETKPKTTTTKKSTKTTKK